MDRDGNTHIKVDPEAEDIRALNRKVQERRDQKAADRRVAQLCVQRAIAQSKADECRQRKLERKRQHLTNKLADRILLCFLLCLVVYLFWAEGVVSQTAFTTICFVCSCSIAYSAGVTRMKWKQLGGEKE